MGVDEAEKVPEKSDIKDNISVCDSELSMSSHGTNDSYERSQNSKSRPVGRKKASLTRETFVVPEPDQNSSDVMASRVKSDSEVIYEAAVSQKIVDEFLLSDSDKKKVIGRTSSGFCFGFTFEEKWNEIPWEIC